VGWQLREALSAPAVAQLRQDFLLRPVSIDSVALFVAAHFHGVFFSAARSHGSCATPQVMVAALRPDLSVRPRLEDGDAAIFIVICKDGYTHAVEQIVQTLQQERQLHQ
jgi:hypothetical protein